MSTQRYNDAVRYKAPAYHLPSELGEIRDIFEAACELGDFNELAEAITHYIYAKRSEDLRSMWGFFRKQSNPALAEDCLALLFGVHFETVLSSADIARQHGVSRSAVSQRLRALKRKFNAHSQAVRRDDVCKKYSQQKKEDHPKWKTFRAYKPAS